MPVKSARELEEIDAEKVNEAAASINNGDLTAAKQLLNSVIRNVPINYAHTTESTDESLYMRFWDQNEFLHYVNWEKPTQNIFWIKAAYPRAYYYLGFIAVSEGNFTAAIDYLDQGMALEPSNPRFVTEKAHALTKSGQHAAALATCEQVSKPGPFVSEQMFAVVLRSKGCSLIELGRLTEAEVVFRKSLEIAPGNEVALNELKYIAQLKLKGGGTMEMNTVVSKFKPLAVCNSCGAKNVSGSFVMTDGVESFVCNSCKLTSVRNTPTKKAWQFWK